MNKKNTRVDMSQMGTFVGRATLPFNVSAYQRSSIVYNIFIHDSIDSAEDFLDAITILNMADEDDEVFIHLSSPGGSVDATDTFLMEMNRCKAKVTVKATGTVASAATLILLSADAIEMSPYCNILFHSASFGYGGKTQDVVEYANFTKAQTEAMLSSFYEHFFTPEELHDILVNKKEYWMNAEEFDRRYAHREAKLNEAEEEMVASIQEQLKGLSLVLKNEGENVLNS